MPERPPDPPTPAAPVAIVALALGDSHSCARRGDGAVWCWGANGAGQLGDGAATDRATAAPVPGLNGATQISAQFATTCVRRVDGTAWCWGANDAGQASGTAGSIDVTGSAPQRVAAQIPGLRGVQEVRCGAGYTCARLSDGTVACWGTNVCQVLGYDENDARSRSYGPARVPGVHDVVALGAATHTVVVLRDGRVRYWPLSCQSIGGADDRVVSEPLAWLGPATQAVAIPSIEIGLGCYRLATGRAFCLDYSARPGLGGPGGIPFANREVDIGLDRVAQVAAGRGFACARTDDGRVWCWGGNEAGQLGRGTRSARREAPAVVAGLDRVVDIAVGGGHACAGRDDGTVWCWGANGAGQLGDGTRVDRAEPVRVAGIEAFAGDVIAAGAGGAAAVDGGECVAPQRVTYAPGCARDATLRLCRGVRSDERRVDCGCDGRSFEHSDWPPTRPFAYYGPCQRVRSGVQACAGDGPRDGEACAASEREAGVVCVQSGSPAAPCQNEGCARRCTCEASGQWRCRENVCGHPSEGLRPSGTTRDAMAVRCVR